MGLPGEEAVETEVPWTIAGTFGSCLLDEVEDLCKSRDDESESDSAVFDSFIPRNLDSAAVVARIVEALDAESGFWKLFKSFFDSISLMKSCKLLSSSDCSSEPELPGCDLSMMSEPGC